MASKKKKAKRERKRVSKEQVRQNAKSGGGGGNRWFTLPDGVEEWHPEKAGRFVLNILPYETKSEDHPDGVEAGSVWYKLPFKVHHGIGPKSESLICPTSLNKPCPICEAAKKLKNDPDVDEETLKALNPQRFVVYNAIHPDDDDKRVLFIMSYGKFAKHLEKELQEDEDEELAYFYDVTEEGKALKVRFSKETFMGKEYLEASRIDFIPRDEMDEDEVLESTVCLEEALSLQPYDKIKAAFLQDEEVGGDEEDEEEEKKPAKPSKKSSKKKPEPEPDDDDDDDEEDNDSDDDDDDDDSDDDSDDDDDNSDDDDDDDDEDDGSDDSDDDDSDDDDSDDDDDDSDDDDDDEPVKPKKGSKKEEKKPAKKEKPAKKSKGKQKCPKGGTFGKDCDEIEGCDECNLWDDCDEAKYGS